MSRAKRFAHAASAERGEQSFEALEERVVLAANRLKKGSPFGAGLFKRQREQDRLTFPV